MSLLCRLRGWYALRFWIRWVRKICQGSLIVVIDRSLHDIRATGISEARRYTCQGVVQARSVSGREEPLTNPSGTQLPRHGTSCSVRLGVRNRAWATVPNNFVLALSRHFSKEHIYIPTSLSTVVLPASRVPLPTALLQMHLSFAKLWGNSLSTLQN